MTAEEPAEHVHDWAPTRNIAQYRCRTCGAFGHKPAFRTGGAMAGSGIIPYRCNKCGGWAVTKQGGRWYCTFHRRP